MTHRLGWKAALAAGGVTAAVLVWLSCLFWPREFPWRAPDVALSISVASPSQQRVWRPGVVLVGRLGEFDDELYAFLMFDYLRTRVALNRSEILLDSRENSGRPAYRVHLVCPNNLLTCIPLLAELRRSRLAQEVGWAFVDDTALASIRKQTNFFVNAYTQPVETRFQSLSPAQRVRHVRRFLRFKSTVDRRVRLGTSGLQPLTVEEAEALAGDMIAVSEFYDLPLDLLLGIGAMENNYLDVRGDLNHAVWKKRAQPGDIVLRRSRSGRVLVRNFSLGRWQITRETLRFVHSLYLADSRDYSLLPERLRPERRLDFDNIAPAVLTTYAGLLLRYLLDYFDGDVAKAAGAYNGGPGRPNEQYEAGVRQVAEYARRILGRAAAMKDAAVASMPSAGRMPLRPAR